MSILAIVCIILKIIGVVLLLILTIILAGLFSRIKFRTIAKINDEVYFFSKISYFFGILNIVYSNQNNLFYIKIFGIDIQNLRIKRKSKNKRNISKKDISENSVNTSDTSIKKDFDIKVDEQENTGNYKNEENNNSEEQENSKVFKTKFNNTSFKAIITYPNKREIFLAFLSLIKDFFKSFKFKKIQVNVEYGVEDPFLTGCICGVISNIIIFLPKKHLKTISIVPNFEKQIFISELDIKGSITLFKILVSLIKFIRKDTIKKIIFRKGE